MDSAIPCLQFCLTCWLDAWYGRTLSPTSIAFCARAQKQAQDAVAAVSVVQAAASHLASARQGTNETMATLHKHGTYRTMATLHKRASKQSWSILYINTMKPRLSLPKELKHGQLYSIGLASVEQGADKSMAALRFLWVCAHVAHKQKREMMVRPPKVLCASFVKQTGETSGAAAVRMLLVALRMCKVYVSRSYIQWYIQ
eukprot:scaffold23584_cov22-Tisochrysis_lutea.AAC.3